MRTPNRDPQVAKNIVGVEYEYEDLGRNIPAPFPLHSFVVPIVVWLQVTSIAHTLKGPLALETWKSGSVLWTFAACAAVMCHSTAAWSGSLRSPRSNCRQALGLFQGLNGPLNWGHILYYNPNIVYMDHKPFQG